MDKIRNKYGERRRAEGTAKRRRRQIDNKQSAVRLTFKTHQEVIY